jgi:endonuclease YncB( thermonuclease family)
MGGNVTRRLKHLRDIVVGLAILALALLIIAKLENEQALRFTGPFVAVDGDTLAAAGERLRIEGIDAPELGQTCERADGSTYACGEEARRTLRALASDGAWECSGTRRDRYQRLLVVCKQGLDDLGERLVAAGAAVADGRYLVAEGKARAAGEGIWAGRFDRPSDWRRLRQVEEAELAGWFQALLPRWMSKWFEETKE